VTSGLPLALVNLEFPCACCRCRFTLSRDESAFETSSGGKKGTPNWSLYILVPDLAACLSSQNKIGEFFARGSFERYLSAHPRPGNYD